MNTQYLNVAPTDVLNFNDVLQLTFTEEESSLLPESLREYNFSYQMDDLAQTFQDHNIGGLLPISPFAVPSGAVSLAVNFINPSSTPIAVGTAVNAVNGQLDYYTDVYSVKRLTLADAMGASSAGDLAAAAGQGQVAMQGTGVASEIGQGVSAAGSATVGFLQSIQTPLLVVGGLVLAFLVWEGSRKAKLLI